MLDFYQYHRQLTIFRTTIDGKLWRQFSLTLEDVPALLVIFRNRTVQRIARFHINQVTSLSLTNDSVDHRQLFNRAIRSYIQTSKAIDDFDDHLWEEISLRKAALKNTAKEPKMNQNLTEKQAIARAVKMIDLELALLHMFRREIPLVQSIRGELYDALVHWLSILTKVTA